jgi:hypothetical protein
MNRRSSFAILMNIAGEVKQMFNQNTHMTKENMDCVD